MSEPFHKRFDIDVAIEEARRRFVNRIDTCVDQIVNRAYKQKLNLDTFLQIVALGLGEPFQRCLFPEGFMRSWRTLINNDFPKCIHATELLFDGFVRRKDEGLAQRFDKAIRYVLSQSEVDLGLGWNGKQFTRKAAQLLDDRLVNEPLHWLRDAKYENVLRPFEKGLKHWMAATNDRERYADVITNMFEALEALAKIVTERDNDFSGNREKFASSCGCGTVPSDAQGIRFFC